MFKEKKVTYFHTSLWCLKKFYKERSENKNLIKIFILIQLSEMHGAGRVKNYQVSSKSKSLAQVKMEMVILHMD